MDAERDPLNFDDDIRRLLLVPVSPDFVTRTRVRVADGADAPRLERSWMWSAAAALVAAAALLAVLRPSSSESPAVNGLAARPTAAIGVLAPALTGTAVAAPGWRGEPGARTTSAEGTRQPASAVALADAPLFLVTPGERRGLRLLLAALRQPSRAPASIVREPPVRSELNALTALTEPPPLEVAPLVVTQ